MDQSVDCLCWFSASGGTGTEQEESSLGKSENDETNRLVAVICDRIHSNHYKVRALVPRRACLGARASARASAHASARVSARVARRACLGACLGVILPRGAPRSCLPSDRARVSAAGRLECWV